MDTNITSKEGRYNEQWQILDEANKAKRRAFIHVEIRREEENRRSAKAVQLGTKGKWTRWKLQTDLARTVQLKPASTQLMEDVWSLTVKISQGSSPHQSLAKAAERTPS